MTVAQSLAISGTLMTVRTGEDSDTCRLVEAARSGDRDAFGSLYHDYAPMVHGILLGRVPRADAEDLVHDVFVTALRKINSLREIDAFGGWLAEIARNLATDHLRREGRRQERPIDSDEDDRSAELAVAQHQADDVDAKNALEAVCSLPEAYRETLVMRLVEGMTGPEIARRTGLAEGSVRVNLHRGMKLLREQMERGGS